MKKTSIFMIVLACAFLLASCAMTGGNETLPDGTTGGVGTTEKPGDTQKPEDTTQSGIDEPSETTNPSEIPEYGTTAPEDSEPIPDRTNILVVYFSATGNTKAVAKRIAELTNGDLYEIVPVIPYTSADLNYNNSNCRANQEMNDPSSRPAIGSAGIDISKYDTVIIGYPIWWGTMPRIINTFLDTYDLSGKTVLPFCTSGGSGISRSVSDIKSTEPNADVKNGLRAGGANDTGLENWLRDNGIGG